MIFVYREYYPDGGMNDCIGSVDSIDKITSFLSNSPRSQYQNMEGEVLNRVTGAIVCKLSSTWNYDTSTASWNLVDINNIQSSSNEI